MSSKLLLASLRKEKDQLKDSKSDDSPKMTLNHPLYVEGSTNHPSNLQNMIGPISCIVYTPANTNQKNLIPIIPRF